MLYTVQVSKRAERQLERLPRIVQERIRESIDALEKTPRPYGMQKMAGIENLYRIRVGSYRILYEIHDAVLVVVVMKVGHRREVYK